MNRNARTRGFTLIEVTVALALIGVVMATIYTVLYGTIEERRRTEIKVQGSRIGPLLLDQIEQDLRQVFSYNIAHGTVFRGEDHRIGGQDADKLAFVAQTPSTSALVNDNRAIYSMVNEVGYGLTQNPENPDFMVLWRREDYYVDDEPLKGGKGTPLYRRITRFNVTYYDELGEDADEIDEWDTEERTGLPAAMEIILELEVQTRSGASALSTQELARRNHVFRRWVVFPTDANLSMAVRPAVPVPPEVEEDPNGPGGDGSMSTFGGGGGKGGGKGGKSDGLGFGRGSGSTGTKQSGGGSTSTHVGGGSDG